MNRGAIVVLLFLVSLAASSPLNVRMKRQYLGTGLGGAYMGGGMGPGLGGGYVGGGLTPEQVIANRELAISQAQTRRAMVASQIATNQAAREAQLMGAEARLAAVETGMIGARRMGLGLGGAGLGGVGLGI